MEVKLSENLVVSEVAKASNVSQSTDSRLEPDLTKSNSQQTVEAVKEVSFAASLLYCRKLERPHYSVSRM